MTTRWRLLIVILALFALIVIVSLPSRTMRLDGTAGIQAPVRGTVHVHTLRSDGSGTVDDVAAAAGRAGLDFVIISDHGDATRTPLAPAYRHGVLCIDAV